MASSQAVDIRKKSEGRVHIVRMMEKDLQLVQLDRMKRRKKQTVDLRDVFHWVILTVFSQKV